MAEGEARAEWLQLRSTALSTNFCGPATAAMRISVHPGVNTNRQKEKPRRDGGVFCARLDQ